MKKGPHSKEVSIDDGLVLFEEYTARLEKMKETKEQIVKDQKLFDIPISK